MAVRFKLVLRKDMSKGAPAGSQLYYPVSVNNGRVSFESLCKEVAEQSSLTSGDVKNCLDRMVYCVANHLMEGRGVDCGDLGGFGLILRSAGAKTVKEYNVQTHMREAKIRFYPGKMLRDTKGGYSFERMSEKPEADGGSDTESPDEI